MKDWSSIIIKIVDKFNIVKIMLAILVVLSLMLVPKINYLDFLMPLDNFEKRIRFIFAILVSYTVITIIIFLGKSIKQFFSNKPKKLLRIIWRYGEYINVFYSDEINEYSPCSIDLDRYNIPKEIIAKFEENRIIELAFLGNGYQLTKKARKKLTRLRKTMSFLNDKLFKTNIQEDANNG